MRQKFPLVSMGGRAEGLKCADPGARTPIGASRNYSNSDRDSDSLENSDMNIGTAVALYPYNGDFSESSIAMEAGEEFIVTEGDEGGWTKVRRKNFNSEGVRGLCQLLTCNGCEGDNVQNYIIWST